MAWVKGVCEIVAVRVQPSQNWACLLQPTPPTVTSKLPLPRSIMPAPASLIVLGLGGVSSSFLQIHAKTAALQSKFLISALANSRFSLLAPKQIPAVDVSAWVTAHPDRKPLDVLSLLEAVQADSRGPVIVVDNSSSPDLAALYPAILKSGASVCTPNKKSTSSSLKLYEEILAAAEGDKAGLYYGESTVGAGLPILSTLKELIATGDEILKVEGVLSGTRQSPPARSSVLKALDLTLSLSLAAFSVVYLQQLLTRCPVVGAAVVLLHYSRCQGPRLHRA